MPFLLWNTINKVPTSNRVCLCVWPRDAVQVFYNSDPFAVHEYTRVTAQEVHFKFVANFFKIANTGIWMGKVMTFITTLSRPEQRCLLGLADLLLFAHQLKQCGKFSVLHGLLDIPHEKWRVFLNGRNLTYARMCQSVHGLLNARPMCGQWYVCLADCELHTKPDPFPNQYHHSFY